MASPLNNNDIIEVRLYGFINGQVLMNVLHYQFAGTTQPNYVNAMQALLGFITAAGNLVDKVLAGMGSDSVINRIDLQPIYPVRLATYSDLTSRAGTHASVSGPQNTSAVVEKRSDSAKRWGIGTFHQMSPPATAFTAGLLTGPYKGIMAAIADKLILVQSAGLGNDYNPVLWSAKVPTRVTLFGRYIVQNTSRVMRRRTVGVGR